MTLWREGLGDVFSDRLWPEFPIYTSEKWDPTMNFTEEDGKYYVTAEIPGLKKEDISVSYDKGCLTISGKRDSSSMEGEAEHFMREMRSGSFCRSFRMPGAIDEKKIDATYKDGILTLVLPYDKEDQKGKKITVH